MDASDDQMSEQQQGALVAFEEFMGVSVQERQVFRLDGPAGSGKTWLAKKLAAVATRMSGRHVLYATYTGKASEVLRSKGCYPSSTLHALAYVPVGEDGAWDLEQKVSELKALERIFTGEPTPQMVALKASIAKAKTEVGQPQFDINYESILWGAGLLVVDEHSMVDEEMGGDLLSFGVKILALGDQFQLPPIEGIGFFMQGAPDYELTEPHRQAAGSAIIYLAGIARNFRSLPFGEFEDKIEEDSDVEVYTSVVKSVGTLADILAADQILCGKNATRTQINKMYRKAKGYERGRPYPGEKMIGLSNNRRTGLRNGTLWTVVETGDEILDTYYGAVISLRLRAENGREIKANAWVDAIQGNDMKEVPFRERQNALEITFGYAMTVHKSQGSQWDNVLLVDESKVFREDEHRHRYTGLTRAAKTVTVVRGII